MPEVAEKWFSILPKDGKWENTLTYLSVCTPRMECQRTWTDRD